MITINLNKVFKAFLVHIFTILLLVTTTTQLYAQQTFTSVRTGDWDDASTWSMTTALAIGAPAVQGVDYPGEVKLNTVRTQEEALKIEIRDAIGRLVYTKNMTINGQETIQIPILNSGVYILSLISNQETFNRKIMLK